VRLFLPLYGWAKEMAKGAKFTVKVHTRDNRDGKDKFDLQDGLDLRSGPLQLWHF
jgi:hypothetical protein